VPRKLRGAKHRATDHSSIDLLAGSCATLGWAEGDLPGFDTYLMRSMEDSIKSFEPNIAAKNAQRALADAQILWDGFRWTEEYFANRGSAEDAVQIARQALEHTGAVMKFLDANDFESAAASARSAARTCRTCHDLYKPS
jgi:hypothetical protein